ncbi:hypothetical protein Dimus_026636 [Dionaea muscipula]
MVKGSARRGDDFAMDGGEHAAADSNLTRISPDFERIGGRGLACGSTSAVRLGSDQMVVAGDALGDRCSDGCVCVNWWFGILCVQGVQGMFSSSGSGTSDWW